MHVIVTGGAGYIGSTVCSALLDEGIQPIIWDSLVVGTEAFTKGRIFYKGDIADPEILMQIKKDYPAVDTMIHCAARIVVDESMRDPALYYRENVFKSAVLFENCVKHGITKVIFSSSASVYGATEDTALSEETPCAPTSPYAATKHMMETILADFCRSYGMIGVSLRYFNPIGADPQMRTGMYKENPSHLLGKLMSVADEGGTFQINGTDWPTRDGTPVRDYIHVWDLALAHVSAVKFVQSPKISKSEHLPINLGTGLGTTVQEFVDGFLSVSGRTLDVRKGPRRAGDIAGAFALSDRAGKLLGWKSERSVAQGIADALSWQKRV